LPFFWAGLSIPSGLKGEEGVRITLRKAGSEIFVPDGKPLEEAISRTTHMGIVAHQDDLEITAYDGILRCFGEEEKWFFGVTATDGRGSPRSGPYANVSDEEMMDIRRREQKKAAVVGEYGALALLNYSSAEVKDPGNIDPIEDIKELVSLAKPSILYTHSLADKHDTHVAVALKAIRALRELPPRLRPKRIYGCEAWGGLDWLVDEDKIVFDVSERENLALALLGIFDSQISGGKRYDIATMGRRKANATYLQSHEVDRMGSAIYAMDLTPLVVDPKLDVVEYVMDLINRFAQDVSSRIAKLI
jgi:LmbE family N-acetylglucosaminyl deacetylase